MTVTVPQRRAAARPVVPVARTFRDYAALVERVERGLVACGRRDLESRLHILSGVYYGTEWSRDFDVERSAARNAGFQIFLARRYTAADDPRRCPKVGAALFESLKRSQDLRGVDMGHALIGLNARMRRASRELEFPLAGSTGLEITTWVGDLGGATARLALDRVRRPAATPHRYFSGTDYGAPGNLEGDVAAYVIGSGSSSQVEPLSTTFGPLAADALRDYFVRRIGFRDRCQRFLRMNGGVVSGTSVSNAAALRKSMAKKFAAFGGLYLLNFVRDRGLSPRVILPARGNLEGAADAVTAFFLDRIVRCMRTGSFRT
jgi:hypothetical protein